MGFACPVCAAPQADGEHLANHLAFSAMLRHDDHEDWLDEHAPDWSGEDPESLAATIVEFVEETEYPEVFEDSTHQDEHEASPPQSPIRPQAGDGELTADARDILAEARELTEQRRRNAVDGDDADTGADEEQ